MSIQDKIREQVTSNRVVLYMKGTPQFPQCGFSASAVRTLEACGAKFAFVNIFEDPELRALIEQAPQARIALARDAYGAHHRHAEGGTQLIGIDRDAALWAPTIPAIEGNGADELGGAVSIPSDKKLTQGMKFRAVLANGNVITGRFKNQLGHGWTPVDGYGLVNAQEAVLGVH